MSGPTVTDAVVLRLVDHGERNRIVTFYTPDLGRIATLARGARGQSRRFSGHLDLFHRGQAQLATSRRGGLPALTDFAVHDAFEGIRADVIRFAIASFFTELVLVTTADQHAAPEQYALFAGTLGELDRSTRDARRDLVLGFQLRWFAALGELPPLDADELSRAHLPVLEEPDLAVGRALLSGAAITDLDEARFRSVGALTRALRHRVQTRPMTSLRFLGDVLRADLSTEH